MPILVFPRPAPQVAEALPAVTPVALPMKPAVPSFAELFAAEESGLLRFAVGLTGRREVAEELVQESFLRLHQLGDEVLNPRAWLYHCLRNLALNHLRDHRRETPLEAAGAAAAEDQLPAETLARMEAAGMVRLLIAELPPGDRDLIRMKYLGNLKYKEISEQTGLSVGHVGYKLHHVLKHLADALRPAGVEGSGG